LGNGVVTPGWSDPITEKLPFFGLPADLTGKRVLDIGCSEGFFSFEAERRGAAEVIAIDAAMESIDRFNLCRLALNSKARGYLTYVYDLSPKLFGTFDIVMFFGVLYHLRHPLLALERVVSVCADQLLCQSASFEDESIGATPTARLYPDGISSGPADRPRHDPTVLWIPNSACIEAMLKHAGLVDIAMLSDKAGAVFRARSPSGRPAQKPDLRALPWA